MQDITPCYDVTRFTESQSFSVSVKTTDEDHISDSKKILQDAVWPPGEEAHVATYLPYMEILIIKIYNCFNTCELQYKSSMKSSLQFLLGCNHK